MEKTCETKSGKKAASNRDIRNRGQLRLKPGIRAIDVSAVRRMIVWSIGECERQLNNLRNTLEVIDGLTAKDTKTKKMTCIQTGEKQ